MADLPFDPGSGLADRLARALDIEGKLPRALEDLGPVAGRDVVLVGGGPLRAAQLTSLGARVTVLDGTNGLADAATVAPASTDAVVSCWSGFEAAEPSQVAAAEALLRPGGRLLVVHDYGRDDVSRLRGERPEYGTWSRRDGPFLATGFRIRVVHCWWTFEGLDEARSFLAEAFGDAGQTVGQGLQRPRLSHNLAVYHRSAPARDA